MLNNVYIKLLLRNIYFYKALFLTISERLLKTIFLPFSLESIFNSNSNLTYTFIILIIRYIFAYNRHIQSNKCSRIITNEIQKYYYYYWIKNPELLKIEENSLILTEIRDHNFQLIFRIFVDLIPGLLSLFIGSYHCVKYKNGYKVVILIILFDLLYKQIIRKKLDNIENVYSKIINNIKRKLVLLRTTGIKNHDTIRLYNQYNHEREREDFLINKLNINSDYFDKVDNFNGCLNGCLRNILNYFSLWLFYDKSFTTSTILILSFYISEIKNGLNDLQYFQYIYIKYTEIFNNIPNIQNIYNWYENENSDYIYESKCFDENILIKNLNIQINNNNILSNINLDINYSKRIGIIGKNGSGKSSLLKIISGYKYEYTYDNIKIPKSKNILLCEQNPCFMNGSVLYNILYSCDDKISSKYYEETNINKFPFYVQKSVKTLNIDHLCRNNINSLSSGEKQLVSVARIYAKTLYSPDKIKVLILDEFESTLDIKYLNLCFSIINQIYNLTDCTLFVVSHNLDTINYLTDESIIIHNSYIIYKGDTSHAIEYYKHVLDKL
jgi:ABC-type bacteriocin/lantibiotic exporter with double-glycine peptidase domain